MKNIITILTLSFTLFACQKNKEKTLDEVLATNNLKEIKTFKDNVVIKQQEISLKLEQLDAKISKLDTLKKIPLVATFIVKDTIFNHYLELQGNVSTKKLLVLYPEYSGVLTRIYVTEGQKVKKGQILAIIDDGGLRQQLAQLQIQANLAKTTFERQARLWKQKIGSEIQYLQAKSNANAQQKAVQQMQQTLAKTIIKAPFSGVIDDVITQQGSVVSPGMSPIIRIVNLTNMYIETDVSEQYITQVTKGKKVQVNFPVLGKSILTKVKQVSSYINPANRTFKVEITVPNKGKSIKPNLTARLKINDYTNPRAILIPQSIVSENANGEQYIYTLKNKKDNTAMVMKTMIKTGLSQGNLIEVLQGLSPNTEIITEGARIVKENQKVEIIK